MESDSKMVSGGIGTGGLLGVAFVVLKLCHVIDWSWWLVTCPFWAIPMIVVIFFGMALIGAIGFFVFRKIIG